MPRHFIHFLSARVEKAQPVTNIYHDVSDRISTQSLIPSPRLHSVAQARNLLHDPRKKIKDGRNRRMFRSSIKMSRKTISFSLPVVVIVQGESRFTRQEIESRSAPLAVLVALEVVLVIVVILRDGSRVPVLVADISRETVAGRRTPLDGLSHAGPMIVTEEDRRRRRRRQLRALKATLKVTGQERLYRVCLRRAWKTERETRSRDQSTTASRSYDTPLGPHVRIFNTPSCAHSSRFSRRPFISPLIRPFPLSSSVFSLSHFSMTWHSSHFSFMRSEIKRLETRLEIISSRGVLLLASCARCVVSASLCKV